MQYDIIGDIHGQADKLHELLSHMGYRVKDGAYRHPERQAIFVGDFIDRGPRQMDTVNTVRRMVDAGSALAVMGNHELNAIAWHTRDPDSPDHFLRPRTGSKGQKNRHQHEAFLAEVEGNPALHLEVIDWFLTLPLWIDKPELRVVHACWHDGYMAEIQKHLTPGLQLTRELLVRASRADTMEFRTVEGLTKGLEVGLPGGRSYTDKDGTSRYNVRIRWWDELATTYQDLALMPEEERQELPAIALVDDARMPYDNAKPVFFGHYWMTGQPQTQSAHAACVDYSAAKDGPLVAYRWSGEAELDQNNFALLLRPGFLWTAG